MNSAGQNQKPIPKISIGMFVYNGESSIREAIDSMLNQTFNDFELIISDNASTDNTEEVCREYEKIDSRIRYIRQPTNLGASVNFQIVFDESKGEYFMWAAHDDIKSPDFLELNLQFLQEHLDYVASTSPVRFIDDLPDPVRMGDKTLDQETAADRFLAGLKTWRACGRFYSLIRRAAIVNSKVIRHATYVGADIALILELAIKGKLNRLEQGYVALGRNGLSGSGNIFRMYRKSIKNWLFPMYELSTVIWALADDFSFIGRVLIAKAIIEMNLITFLHQFKIEIIQWIQRVRR